MVKDTQGIMIDRIFDAACLKVKGEEEWSEEIIEKLKKIYPEYEETIDKIFNIYIKTTRTYTAFSKRADYMIEHKNNLKLKYR